MLTRHRGGAVGFIDWLDAMATQKIIDHTQANGVKTVNDAKVVSETPLPNGGVE